MYGDSMEVEIVEKTENPLLQRIDVRFKISHSGAPTPKRMEVKEKLAAMLQVQQNLIVIEKMASVHGKSETNGIARAYQSEEKMKALEPEHLLKRGIPKEKPKEEKPKE